VSKLITPRYPALSVSEKNILAALDTYPKNVRNEITVYQIPVAEFAELIGDKDINTAIEELHKLIITIPSEEGGFTKYGLFAGAKHNVENNLIELAVFHHHLKKMVY
jgi:hypothetical protein